MIFKGNQVIIITGFLCCLLACVSNKKSVYLQDKAAKQSQDNMDNKTFNRAPVPYKLQVGDILSIQISKLNNIQSAYAITEQLEQKQANVSQDPMNNGYKIKDNGQIDLPVLGEIKARGLTLEELERNISVKADSFYTEPFVKVFLFSFYVKVLGEVKQPGNYQMYQHQPTIFDALSLAGGLLYYGDRRAVKLVRTLEGSTTVSHIDLTDQAMLEDQYYFLHPDDMIYVKPLKSKQFSESNLPLILSVISTITVVVSLILR